MAHCPTCTCLEPDAVEVELTLPAWLWILVNAAGGWLCVHCGCVPFDDSEHREGCSTVGTCAQCEPNTMPRPWHPESEWLTESTKYGEQLRRHLAEAHS